MTTIPKEQKKNNHTRYNLISAKLLAASGAAHAIAANDNLVLPATLLYFSVKTQMRTNQVRDPFAFDVCCDQPNDGRRQ